MEEDYGALDRNEYQHFTGPARLGKAMATLHGLVQGIVADGKVTDEELASLVRWVSIHSEFAERHPFDEIIPRLQDVITDRTFDEEERADVLWLAERVSAESDYYDVVTSDMQQLQGFLAGVLSDGIVTEDELAGLSAWIDEHAHLKSCWPYDELESIICYVMKDGQIDPQEHEALLQFFGEFTNTAKRKSVGALDRDTTVSGTCATCPEIVFADKLFCLTGTSDRGPRAHVAEVIQQQGGLFHNSVRNDTAYLVVGSMGNPCWAYACYGRKVEDAAVRRRKGQQIVIVHVACYSKSGPVVMKVKLPVGKEILSMSTKRRRRHSPEQVVKKLRDADAMLNAGQDLASVLQSLEVSESTLDRWRKQYGGMKSEEAVRLKKLEDENRRLKQLVADLSLDNQALKIVAEGNF